MKKNSYEFDAVVVGAGTAGASAAFHLARAGFSTALLEAGPLNKAGARWVNAVPPWMFDYAGIDRPEPPELRGKDFPMSLRDSEGNERLLILLNPFWDMDMRLLVKRVQDLALKMGATPFEKMSAKSFSFDGERPTVLHAVKKGPKGAAKNFEFRAKLFVDATGLVGALRSAAPCLAEICPLPATNDLCAAAQCVYEIRDLDGAREYLDAVGAQSASSINYFGVDGGFSSLMVHPDLDKNEVGILGGTTAEAGRKTGKRVVEEFVELNPWVGKAQYGGQALIPLRRPYDRFAAPGLALVGNAACHVFSAHGSGVGSGMIAGKILADAAMGHSDPGCLEVTWDYQAKFMRKIGAVNAAYDVLRRLAQSMDSEEIDRMVSASLLLPGTSRSAMDQRMPKLEARDGLQLIRAALNEPMIVARYAPGVAKMQAVYALYKFYPPRPDERRLKLWASAAAKLIGCRPDVY